MNICNECNKNFSNKYILATHLRNIHGPVRERLFLCNFEASAGIKCNKRFMTKHHLAKHQEIVHNTTDKNFECPTCNKKFKSANNLTTHQKSHHKSFLCRHVHYKNILKLLLLPHQTDSINQWQLPNVILFRYCNATFFREQDVRNHEAAIHEKQQKFICNECEKTFSQLSNLLTHIRSVHRNIKLYHCQKCNNSFSRKRLLLYHLAAIHKENVEQMTLNCTACTFTTIYPSHLIRHRKTHESWIF